MWGDILLRPSPSEWQDTVAAVAGHPALIPYPSSLTDILVQTWHVEVNSVLVACVWFVCSLCHDTMAANVQT